MRNTGIMRSAKTGIAAIVSLALLASGCGVTAPADPQTDPGQSDTASTEASTTETESTGTDTTAPGDTGSPADKLAGKWVFIYSMYHSDSDDGNDYDYCTMSTDEYAPSSKVTVTKKDDKLLADYKFGGYENMERIYGNELTYHTGTAYEGCPNTEWYCEFTNPDPDDTDYNFNKKMTLTEDDRLIVSEEYTDPPAEDYSGYHSITEYYYLRDDSPLLDDMESLRYFDTVTVENAVEFINSIQNNRKILLKPGIYNLSSISPSKINNSKVNESYGQFLIDDVRNLAIEPESEGDILICIGDAYSPVLSFQNGGNLTIRGITAGHDVEPGYCSGSVLYFDAIDGLTIDKCKLFGCGTYGIEASNTYRAEVTDTEIYECTYGLVDLRQSSGFHFKDCVMRDSKDMSMLCLNSVYDITFEDCEFRNNNSMAYESCSFVELGEYDSATFRGCSFKNNEFYTFSNREVSLENCTSDNNHAGFNDLINQSAPLTREELLTAYEETRTKQAEIDEKLSSDSLMDQVTLNQTANDEYTMWDSLLNKIWTYLGEKLSEEEMTALTEEQHKWIVDKEAAVKEAVKDFEGGSMKPMIEYGTAASITQKRVAYLVETYLRKSGT